MNKPDIIQCKCPHCGKSLKGPRKSIGKLIKCPVCHKKLRVSTHQTPPSNINAEKNSAPQNKSGFVIIVFLLSMASGFAFWQFAYKPSLSWMNRKAFPEDHNKELGRLLREVDVRIREAKQKLMDEVPMSKYPEFKGVRYVCYECKMNPVKTYRTYHSPGDDPSSGSSFSSVSIGFCNTCVPPKSLSKYGRSSQPESFEYQAYQKSKKSFDEEFKVNHLDPLMAPFNREKEEIRNRFGVTNENVVFWRVALIVWAIVGFCLIFLIIIVPLGFTGGMEEHVQP